MEALAALSLAGNVVQFVDFGQKLISRTKQIYASGTLTVHEELETLVNDLSKLCVDLVESRNKIGSHGRSAEEHDVLPLAASCQELGVEFSTLLQKLRVQSRSRKWATIQQALKSMWNDKAVQKYAKRLEGYRSQISVHLLKLLR